MNVLSRGACHPRLQAERSAHGSSLMRVGFCPFRGSGAPLCAAHILVQPLSASQDAWTVTSIGSGCLCRRRAQLFNVEIPFQLVQCAVVDLAGSVQTEQLRTTRRDGFEHEIEVCV
jgi:hypothetical protein